MSQEEHAQLISDILVAITALPGVMAWKNPTGLGKNMRGGFIKFGLPGSGDIIGAWAGKPLAIDAKTGNARQQANQMKFQAAWEIAGGVYILARSVDDVFRTML